MVIISINDIFYSITPSYMFRVYLSHLQALLKMVIYTTDNYLETMQ